MASSPHPPVPRRARGIGSAERRGALLWPRQHTPVYSPIRTRDLLKALEAGLLQRTDPRSKLAGILRDQYRAEHVVLCGSGTQALQVALVAALRRVGECPVALPAYTCFDVGAAAVATDVPIALYDVEPGTLVPDMAGLRRVLREGARIVVVSPLFGISPDWDGLLECAAEHGAVVIEDAAQGHGARWQGRPLGSLAPLSILSFARGKGWTGGRGGAVLFRGGGFEEDLRSPPRTAELRLVLEATAMRYLGQPALYALPSRVPWLGLGDSRYRPAPAPGAMTRSAAALLAGSRERADEEADARRRIAAWWDQHVTRREHIRKVRVDPASTPGYLRYPLGLRGGLGGIPDRAEAVRLGLAPVYPDALAALPEVRGRLVDGSGSWPGAEELAAELVTLPTHSRLTPDERSRLLDLVNG
jgi:perosamine synthetase